MNAGSSSGSGTSRGDPVDVCCPSANRPSNMAAKTGETILMAREDTSSVSTCFPFSKSWRRTSPDSSTTVVAIGFSAEFKESVIANDGCW
jgi:hypothetical protein